MKEPLMPVFKRTKGSIKRSVADSNRCNWFCRPAPSHSANRPDLLLCAHKISKKIYFFFSNQPMRSREEM